VIAHRLDPFIKRLSEREADVERLAELKRQNEKARQGLDLVRSILERA
jgi:hypothetical protein